MRNLRQPCQEQALIDLPSWNKLVHLFFADQARKFTVDWGRGFADPIPGATFDVIQGAGQFVQETGAPLAELIVRRSNEE